MLSRGGRAWIVWTMLATILLPAVGTTASPKDELEQVQAELDKVQAEIERDEGKLDDLEARRKELTREILVARRAVYAIAEDVARIESESRTIQARIDATQAEIDEIQELATQQAVELYKAGSLETIDALLNARSLTDLDDRVELLGVAAKQNTGALVRYGRLRIEIEAHHRDLLTKKQELEQALAAREKVLADLEQLHAENAQIIARIEAELGEEHAHEGELKIREKRLEQTILERSTLSSVASLGKSDQGFIWPLNGSITSYYGPRWGRMHTGIDIDGTTGEPIVSSKAGRVIQAGPYSGYGNCVIIDHGGGVATLYAHMASIDVSYGQDVAQGEIVGAVGCTGSCTGDHLHFEVRVNGSPRDPLDYLP